MSERFGAAFVGACEGLMYGCPIGFIVAIWFDGFTATPYFFGAVVGGAAVGWIQQAGAREARTQGSVDGYTPIRNADQAIEALKRKFAGQRIMIKIKEDGSTEILVGGEHLWQDPDFCRAACNAIITKEKPCEKS